jgi:diamine N-acetyltransferase
VEIALRPTTEADLDFVLAAETSPEARGWVTVESREDHRAAIEDEGQEHLIVTGPGGESLGYVIVSGIGGRNASIEVRRIAVTEPGRGIGREAVRQAVERAFAEHRAHRVWLDVNPENERAKRVYRALGFVSEGKLRDAIRFDGEWQSLEIMSLLEHEWR